MKKWNVFLASNSPRRHELLSHIVTDFKVKTKDIDEHFPANMPVDKVAEYLARYKAKAYSDLLKVNDLYITADTVVVLDGSVLGKPKDREDAISMLYRLSNKMHKVITGVCVMSSKKMESFSSLTKVYFRELKENEISFYVDHYKPYDKAGGYAIQEWIGMVGIKRLDGDYFNVMGLPIYKLHNTLNFF